MHEQLPMNTVMSLSDFLHQSDLMYKDSLSTIDLFNPKKTSTWSTFQKSYFAAIFYHLRGHFINFVWYIANFSKDEAVKNIILQNIKEELGSNNRYSHELLYERFANECGVNIHDEIINETHYLPFAKSFNKAHLQWISSHDLHEQLCAFAAYERLDNLDYPLLLNLANSLNLTNPATAFFKVHVNVAHFDSTRDLIQPIWDGTPEKVSNSFNFIYSHQLTMWQEFSDRVFTST